MRSSTNDNCSPSQGITEPRKHHPMKRKTVHKQLHIIDMTPNEAQRVLAHLTKVQIATTRTDTTQLNRDSSSQENQSTYGPQKICQSSLTQNESTAPWTA
eukprot:4082257-Amphidinium_carterae.2